ncbi:hypothetical protein CS369_15965 [Candidatus Symbiopectobacterium sp. 'North America']|nr:hypothetical protein [Candidatus Symbiopectobacterium sp. 'North America']
MAGAVDNALAEGINFIVLFDAFWRSCFITPTNVFFVYDGGKGGIKFFINVLMFFDIAARIGAPER